MFSGESTILQIVLIAFPIIIRTHCECIGITGSICCELTPILHPSVCMRGRISFIYTR